MNVKNTRKPQRRVQTIDMTRLGIQAYGDGNLYPQHIMDIVAASGTATLCLNRYHKFVEGNGFIADNVYNMEVARGVKMDDILHAVSRDLCMFGGIAIHVDYNAMGEISSMHHVPFENCRKEIEDEEGNVTHICVHPDWTGQLQRRGKRISVSNEYITRYNVFNPDPVQVQKEIEEAGGLEHYKGQILYAGMDGAAYPIPIYDSVITEISTDEGLGNAKYRNVRNNFLVSAMVIVKKGAPDVSNDGQEEEADGLFTENLSQFQGDTRLGQLMLMEVNDMDDAPVVKEFPSRNFDKDFTATETSTVERIYAQFHQEAFYALRTGRTGFSTENERSAYESYAGEVTYEQRFMERIFARIMNHWRGGGEYNLVIQPLRYISIGQ